MLEKHTRRAISITADISIVLITAREDFSMMGLPDTHILASCMESLEKQTFKSFELVVIDALYDYRSKMFDGLPFSPSFPVKHKPVHPDHRFWLSRYRPSSCAAFNTGIIHSEGELIVKLDDCCQFGSDYLAKIWDFYNCGYYPLSLHVCYMGGKPAYFQIPPSDKETENRIIEEQKKKYGGDGLIRDTRWKEVEAQGGQMIADKTSFFGYSSAPLKSLLNVNGMDELMDGDLSLMDVDLGQRIVMSEHDNIFLLDKNLWVIRHSHTALSDKAVRHTDPPIKCNYAILKLNEKKKRQRANCDKLTSDDIQFIKEETLRHPCSYRPHLYLDDCEGPMFKLWLDNQPNFSLEEERKEIVQK